MALITNERNLTYLKIADFSICEKYSSEQDGWEILKTKDNEGKEYTSWIKRYKMVEGLITKIEFTKRTLPGKNIKVSSWDIHLYDVDLNEKYILQIPSTSPAASRFIKLAENIDPDLPVQISAWKDTSEAKAKQAFMIKQVGNNVPQKYTIKDGKLADYANPNWEDAPGVRLSKSGDKDWLEVEDFLFEKMETVVMPKFEKNEALMTAAAKSAIVEEDNDSNDVEEDEIPFN